MDIKHSNYSEDVKMAPFLMRHYKKYRECHSDVIIFQNKDDPLPAQFWHRCCLPQEE